MPAGPFDVSSKGTVQLGTNDQFGGISYYLLNTKTNTQYAGFVTYDKGQQPTPGGAAVDVTLSCPAVPAGTYKSILVLQYLPNQMPPPQRAPASKDLTIP